MGLLVPMVLFDLIPNPSPEGEGSKEASKFPLLVPQARVGEGRKGEV
jgi:hypothetical protein